MTTVAVWMPCSAPFGELCWRAERVTAGANVRGELLIYEQGTNVLLQRFHADQWTRAAVYDREGYEVWNADNALLAGSGMARSR